LFDHLSADGRGGYDLPFPFTALLERLARGAGCVHAPRGAYQDCYRGVLIPLGRSLQRGTVRDAAKPISQDFYKYPRAVFAIVDDHVDNAGAPLAKDRLYLGYHESAGVVEIISYNEAGGRFEFQVVQDYRAGGLPRVFYANRMVCVACHQNHAPIFSRQVWDETNANPAIARALLSVGRQFYGVKVERGVDIPQAIDNAVNRANLFAAQQLLWRHGCGGNDLPARRCRAAGFTAALQYALNGELGYDTASGEWRESFHQPFAARFSQRWPHGLALPESGVPNRDPLQTEQSAELGHVAAKFDPLQPRARSAVWQQAEAQRQLVAGIAATFSRADIAALNRALARQRVKPPMHAYPQRCNIARQARRIAFECTGEGSKLRGSVQRDARGAWSGSIEQLSLPGGARLARLELSKLNTNGMHSFNASLSRNGFPARTVQGHLLARFGLRGVGAESGNATIEVTDDFSALRAAVARLAADTKDTSFADLPYRRAAVMSALWRTLGVRQPEVCCSDTSKLPAARTDTVLVPPIVTDEALAPFLRYCAACHQSNERTPPNFLLPAAASPAQGVQHCAQRIYYRLAMWQQAPQAREKTPMPPQVALRNIYSHPDAWPRSAEFTAMQRYAARAIQDFDARTLLAQPYETLRSCLPPRNTQGAQQ
jgi:mono/diheme cytochrome c family protein